MSQIRGVVPVIPIPFHADETIDQESFTRTVEFVASQQMAGMCLPAYYSEYYKLTEAEREWTVATAVEISGGRVPVIAQANHGSAIVAAQLAARYESLGADLISFALPRQFALKNLDLLRFAGCIADAVSIPILVQDFNPGGSTIDGKFIAALHQQHGNVQYVKLEEPLMTEKLLNIRDHIDTAVTVFEGWGGYYMLEALSVDNCAGIMPGVPLSDLLMLVYSAHREGNMHRAYELFGSILPFISFTLQNFELFLRLEKQLLVRRRLFQNDICRTPTITLGAEVASYSKFLLDQIMTIGCREFPDDSSWIHDGARPAIARPHILYSAPRVVDDVN